MAVFVLLLRAIGPETHRRMSMADLRAGCEAAGLEDVATHGNTGNLLCRSKKSPHAVRQLVQEVVDGFGIGAGCEVFVRTRRQLAHVVAANPFPDTAQVRPQHIGVCVFHRSPRWPGWVRNYDGLHRMTTVGAHLVVDYLNADGSPRIDIEKRVGARMTQRNWRVLTRLAEMAAALDKS